MKKLSARRRHPLAAFVVLLFALAATGGLYAAFAPTDQAVAETASSTQIEEGKKLFAVGCSSCHGINGEGTTDGPPLVGVGAAAVDFQVGTGRMPAEQPGAQAPRKPGEYSQDEIDALAAYVASLGAGPSIPTESQFDPAGGDLVEGGELFRTNCSQCHNFAGQGGALTDGKYAPSLEGVDPKHIYEAMLTGPQNMPSFPDTVMPEEDKQAIISFITYTTEEEPSYGGNSLGSIGPVSEGLFAWIVGLGGLIAVAIWIAARTPKATKS
ncbi:cytochrome bc1 complex diheme cytochrome c subunit [Allostreptomyces psammosilenae]|uniref:Cytochrome bc1 complex cytochrome c subunit n=1 Tax=Allostreptomyces psammosilenae TaxID=1892865 RepID=A0A852ZXF6_9ACTN|nr:c-type cytochrome [Allostreptomyces psammosilenae]NYI07026.1 ubiquinol-cytochrome c reductase cytochrome c subunit [Allostreptomyces psammosilenae]